MNRKMSVIIPAYNAEAYIERALNSIKNQTYSNIELIVVNDGSTDKTQLIVERFFTQNSYINGKLVNIQNGGLANARNVGIMAASGDFMCNLDADDYLDFDIFEKINSIDEDFDVCYYGWKDIEEISDKLISKYSDRFIYTEGVVSGIDCAIMKLRKQIWICQGNAIYRLEMIKQNKILNIKGINQGEDIYFIIRALLYAKKVCCIKNNSFNCLIRKSSMMHASFNLTHLQTIEARKMLLQDVIAYDFLGKKREDVIGLIKAEYFNSVVALAKKICDSIDIFHPLRAKKEMLRYIPNITVTYNEVTKYLKNQKKVEYLFYRYSKILFFCITKIYRIFKS